MDIVPNLDEASRPLADAWQQTLQATRPEAAALLADLAAHSPPDLAHHFYDVLLEDPRASRFLSHDTDTTTPLQEGTTAKILSDYLGALTDTAIPLTLQDGPTHLG